MYPEGRALQEAKSELRGGGGELAEESHPGPLLSSSLTRSHPRPPADHETPTSSITSDSSARRARVVAQHLLQIRGPGARPASPPAQEALLPRAVPPLLYQA